MGTLPKRGRAETVAAATPEAIWSVLADPTRLGEWSHETSEGVWLDGAASARPGARYRAGNRAGRFAWTRENEIVTADAPREQCGRTAIGRPRWKPTCAGSATSRRRARRARRADTMRHEESIDIAATADIVWSVLTDVERWPEWTASMTRVERLDHGPFAIGSRVRIKQPKLPATVWEVTALAPERSFSWTAKSPGATTVADHELRSAGDAVTVTLRTRQDGPVGRVLGRLISSLTRRYVGMEARGLKQRSEVTASS